MHNTPERRLGVAAGISGFVVVEDADFLTRVRRQLAHWRARAKALCGAVLARHGRLRADVGQRLRTLVVPAAPLIARLALRPAPRVRSRGVRSVPFALIFGYHYLVRRGELGFARLVQRFDRRIVRTGALAGISALALAGALMVPSRGDLAEPPKWGGLADRAAPEPDPLRLTVEAASVAVPLVPELQPEGTWVPVKRPIPLFSLESPEVEPGELTLRVAVRGRDARQDLLTWAERAGRRRAAQRPLVHLAIERFEGGMPAARPFFADLAARGAVEDISIEKMAAVESVAAKFGAVEVADAILATPRGTLGCLMFRHADAMGLALAGWMCGSAERPVDRVGFVCFLDRLDLVGAGPDIALKRYFAQSERSRKTCATPRAPGRKSTWLDPDAPLPKLKLAAARA